MVGVLIRSLIFAVVAPIVGSPLSHVPPVGLHGGPVWIAPPPVLRKRERSRGHYHLHPNTGSCSQPTSWPITAGYDPTFNATTPYINALSVRVNCVGASTFTLSANFGNNASHATGSCGSVPCSRAATQSSQYIPYDLFLDAACTIEWNTTNVISETNNGGTLQYPIFIYVPPAVSGGFSANAVGSYIDSITVTLTY